MKFCTIFFPLRKENFIEGTLNRDTFGSRFAVCEAHFVLFHNGPNHEMQVRHGRRVKI